jgi:hypothetical protein
MNTTPTIILPPGYTDRNTKRGQYGNAVKPADTWRTLYRRTWVDTDLRVIIEKIREMDGQNGKVGDPRVKRIHSNTSTYIAKGGLSLFGAEREPRIMREWRLFQRRLRLDTIPKLKSDARQFVLQGNLALELLTDGDTVTGLASLPADTIVPNVDERGRIPDPKKAYIQWDVYNGFAETTFSLGTLLLARLDPPNYDDLGAFGRPMLDASRDVYEKLIFSEEKLVQRRASRASLRLAHIMEGVTTEELEAYRQTIEANQYQGHDTDYFMNRKGAIQPVQGDAALSDIGDVIHLMNIFFASAPAPSGLFGWGQELSRDVLQELKDAFFVEVDAYQEHIATVYQEAFEIQLALKCIDPLNYDFYVEYNEPRTLSDNQRADLALKDQALGMPRTTVIRTRGFNPAEIQELVRAEDANPEAFFPPQTITTNNGPATKQPKVTVSPEAAGRGHSRTDISN